MAQRIQTLLIDDLDGGEADGTVRFGLDGTDYEIDLSAAHSDELRKALGHYLAHARRVGGAGLAASLVAAPRCCPVGHRPSHPKPRPSAALTSRKPPIGPSRPSWTRRRPPLRRLAP